MFFFLLIHISFNRESNFHFDIFALKSFHLSYLSTTLPLSMTPNYQLSIGCWLVTAPLGLSGSLSTCAHPTRTPVQGAAPLRDTSLSTVQAEKTRDWMEVYAGSSCFCSELGFGTYAHRSSAKRRRESIPHLQGCRETTGCSGLRWIILSPETE